MGAKERLAATVVMWLAFMVLMAVFLTAAVGPASRIGDDTMFGITLVLSTAIAVATYSVWRGLRTQPEPQAGSAEVRKAKRLNRERVARLVEQLDDDALIELETLLEMQGQAGDPADRERVEL